MSQEAYVTIFGMLLALVVAAVSFAPIWLPIWRKRRTITVATNLKRMRKAHKKAREKEAKKAAKEIVDQLADTADIVRQRGSCSTHSKRIADWFAANGYTVDHTPGSGGANPTLPLYRESWLITLPNISEKELNDMIVK